MSEQEQMSQLSALFDNELPPAEAELVIRRVLKDPVQRARWQRYAVIGACVRNEPVLVPQQTSVAERVRAGLAAESEHVESGAPVMLPSSGVVQSGWARFGRGALGGAIAAGVAALSLFVFRYSGSQLAGPEPQLAAVESLPAAVEAQPQPVVQSEQVSASPVRIAAADAPRSYTTPVDDAASQRAAPLVNFLVAHSQVGMVLPLSAGVNGYDLDNAVEMSEAEIRAYR